MKEQIVFKKKEMEEFFLKFGVNLKGLLKKEYGCRIANIEDGEELDSNSLIGFILLETFNNTVHKIQMEEE